MIKEEAVMLMTFDKRDQLKVEGRRLIKNAAVEVGLRGDIAELDKDGNPAVRPLPPWTVEHISLEDPKIFSYRVPEDTNNLADVEPFAVEAVIRYACPHKGKDLFFTGGAICSTEENRFDILKGYCSAVMRAMSALYLYLANGKVKSWKPARRRCKPGAKAREAIRKTKAGVEMLGWEVKERDKFYARKKTKRLNPSVSSYLYCKRQNTLLADRLETTIQIKLDDSVQEMEEATSLSDEGVLQDIKQAANMARALVPDTTSGRTQTPAEIAAGLVVDTKTDLVDGEEAEA